MAQNYAATPPPPPPRAADFPPRPDPSGDNPVELLDPRIDLVREDWIAELAPRKAFRVRGLSWFRANVVLEVTALAPCLPEVPEAIAARPAWAALNVPWSRPRLSIRQVYDAVDKKPLLFHKAAEICLLCELAASDPARDPGTVAAATLYQHLRIEPALWGISDFGRGMLEQVLNERPDAPQVVRRRCLQESIQPLYDVADGKTVSHRLAVRMVRVLRDLCPKLPIGDVILKQNHKANGVCLTETIDGPSTGDWNEVLSS